MNKNIPRVEFKVAKLNEIFPAIHKFLNPEQSNWIWDWSDRIYKEYPWIKNKLQNVKDRRIRKDMEYSFFKNIIENDKNGFENRSKLFQKKWNRVNDSIMNALSDVLEIKWSKTDKKFVARVSLNPICPRDIHKRNFDIFYKKGTHEMIGTSIHEIHHFIYFEKWKEVFPGANEKEFDYPHLVWKLSEMVPKIILNDQRVQKAFKYQFGSYKIYEEAKIDGKPLLSYLQDFYDNRKDFSDFLRKSWKFVNKRRREINKL
ncbi:MAG: hypothetical protein KKE23_04300 [Nanoarchaeota archaeon]|nr:hypothetical protein [Nanoarchaeota archaeon]